MDNITALLERIAIEEKIAGMTVAVTDRKGILFAEGFGVESIERPEVKVTPSSLFRIASITKIVTGITVMQLVDEGKLDPDTPIRAYLPDLRLSREEAEKTVTLRHLLSHTSGLPAEYTPDGPLEESALEKSLAEGLPCAEMASLPGEGKFLYSNWGIRLASLVAEKASGLPYTVLAKARVLDPLGMHLTTFDLHRAATFPICLPHEEENGVFRIFHRLQENAARHAAGGLYSNAIELCSLARFLLNDGVSDDGKRLLSSKAIKEMKTPHGSSPEGFSYGLTLRLEPYRDRFLCGHHGSAPPYATGLLTDEKSGLGIVVLMNTQRDALRTRIPKLILDQLA